MTRRRVPFAEIIEIEWKGPIVVWELHGRIHAQGLLCARKNVSSSILPEARGKSTLVQVSRNGLKVSIGLAGRLPQRPRDALQWVTRRVTHLVLHPLPYALPRLSTAPHSREKAVRSFLGGVVSRKNRKK
jgi:hypothetical protein